MTENDTTESGESVETTSIESLRDTNIEGLKRLEARGVNVPALLADVRNVLLVDYLLPPGSFVRSTFDALLEGRIAGTIEQVEGELLRATLLEGVNPK